MKKLLYFTFILVAAGFVSCKKDTKTTEENYIHFSPDTVAGINALKPITICDSFTVNGVEYNYTFTMQPNDTFPTVTNSLNEQYYDNEVFLTVKREDDICFKKHFTKHDFKQLVPEADFENAALVGFNYNLNEEDDHKRLNFIATVGDPDENGGPNFYIAIKMNTNGEYTIEEAKDIETNAFAEDEGV